MIQLEQILSFYPPILKENILLRKYIFKEYIQLMILDFLSNTKYISNLTFIGGTNLRLVKGIDRFSEDLDFDIKNLSKNDFFEMTNSVLLFLERSGIKVEPKDKENQKLIAFRRNLHFPELLFDLGLSGYREERFLIKIEAQDQELVYKNKLAYIQSCGFYFAFPVPPDDVLCSMKLLALISRAKGRDFYDAIFLLSQTEPNYTILNQKLQIKNFPELKAAILKMLISIDLSHKVKDFEHLLFVKDNSKKVLLFPKFIDSLPFNGSE